MTMHVADGECVVMGQGNHTLVTAFHSDQRWFLFRLDCARDICERSDDFRCYAEAAASLRWGTVKWRRMLTGIDQK